MTPAEQVEWIWIFDGERKPEAGERKLETGTWRREHGNRGGVVIVVGLLSKLKWLKG
jgi:hypothetical protein